MGKGAPRGGQQPKKEMIDNPLRTSKGNFQFTLVADGIYIEHQVRGICRGSAPQAHDVT